MHGSIMVKAAKHHDKAEQASKNNEQLVNSAQEAVQQSKFTGQSSGKRKAEDEEEDGDEDEDEDMDEDEDIEDEYEEEEPEED